MAAGASPAVFFDLQGNFRNASPSFKNRSKTKSLWLFGLFDISRSILYPSAGFPVEAGVWQQRG